MRILALALVLAGCTVFFAAASLRAGDEQEPKPKPSPEEALALLKAGNLRFAEGQEIHPHVTAQRLQQAASEDQGDHAYATVLTCSDSRVPVELIFDTGIMDLFVVRVAGNVCGTDEIGSVEYGLVHVRTPVVVILGHTQCGAVTAMVRSHRGDHQELEANIPALLNGIAPAVARVLHAAGDKALSEEHLVDASVRENVGQAMYDLFLVSPTAREAVKSGKAKVVGAVYDIGTGRVEWMSRAVTKEALARAAADPDRVTERMAERHALALTGLWEIQDSDLPDVKIRVAKKAVLFDCDEPMLRVLWRGVIARLAGDRLELMNLAGRNAVEISEDGRTLTWPGGVVWKKQ